MLTETEKLATVLKLVPATLPLSFIPSTNDDIMTAFAPIMRRRHILRESRERSVHSVVVCYVGRNCAVEAV
jgi:hypothetical protein